MSYGLTDSITLGANLFYTFKFSENSSTSGTSSSFSNGMDDILTLMKFAVLKSETSYLSAVLAVKWNSAFYVSSSEKPPIGSGGTTLDCKILYDVQVIHDFWITMISNYNYLITDNDSRNNNYAGFVITGDFPIWENKLYGEIDAEISYSFPSGSSKADSEWFFKGFLGLQYKISKTLFYQLLAGYGGNGDGDKDFLFMRTGVAMSF